MVVDLILEVKMVNDMELEVDMVVAHLVEEEKKVEEGMDVEDHHHQ